MTLGDLRQKFMWAAIPLLCGLLAGCGFFTEVKSASRNLKPMERPPDRHLKKTIALADFKDFSGFDKQGFKNIYDKVLRETLEQKCSDNRLINLGGADSSSAPSNLPIQETGLVDNLALAEIGRRIGANVVLIGAVFDVSGKQEKRGIWWFRGSRSYIQLQLVVEAYEMETGAKILDKSASGELRVDDFEVQQLQNGQLIPNPDLQEKIAKLAERLGKKVCKEVKKLPWRAFVTSGDQEIRISAGQKVGVKSGARFDVFDNSRILETRQGQRFYVPGNHLGRIEITGVDDHGATAKLVSGSPPAVGSSVRVASKKKK